MYGDTEQAKELRWPMSESHSRRDDLFEVCHTSLLFEEGALRSMTSKICRKSPTSLEKKIFESFPQADHR